MIDYGKEREPHPFHVKSDWNSPVQPSGVLETFLEEVKLELAEIQLRNQNLTSHPESYKHSNNCRVTKPLYSKRLKMMSKNSKINEGLALLNEKNNYQPLTQPMVESTTRKVT